MESLRRGLIRWNIAPLSLVAFLVWAMTDMTLFYQSSACELPDWHVGAIMGYLIGIAGIIYKMYDSLQKDRGRDDSYRDREEDNQA